MSDWKVTQLQLEHPLHGRFSISFYDDGPGYATALRCYPVGRKHETEWVGTTVSGQPHLFKSVEAAQAAVAQRISELDAGLPVVCSAQSDGFRCEQLEAHRDLTVAP